MKKTRCFSVLPGRLRLLRIGLGSAAFLSGALLLADVLVNAGGGSSNADKTGNGGGILDYGQVTFSGSASYENNTVRGFSQGGAVSPNFLLGVSAVHQDPRVKVQDAQLLLCQSHPPRFRPQRRT